MLVQTKSQVVKLGFFILYKLRLNRRYPQNGYAATRAKPLGLLP